MSIMTRSEIIAEVRTRAGRKGQAIGLTNAFDFILQKITRDYPVLRNICHSFTTVASQAYVTLPSDYRSWEQCYYGAYELEWIEPEEYQYNVRMLTDTAGTPSQFTVLKDERKLYFWNKPSGAVVGYFYYSALHPKVDRVLSFTSGGTYEIKQGDTVTGHTSSATMVVSFVRVTSGSWVGGDAVGTIMGTVAGTFVAENLDVGANLNVAGITANATSADSFQHFIGEEFDEAIIEGVTWKCMELISDKNAQEKVLVRDKKREFEDLLRDGAGLKNRRSVRTAYRGF